MLAAACPLIRDILRGQEGDEDKLIIFEGYSKQDVDQFLAAVYGLVDISSSSIPTLLVDLSCLADQGHFIKQEMSVDQDLGLDDMEGEGKWLGLNAEVEVNDNSGEDNKCGEVPDGSDKDFSPGMTKIVKKAKTRVAKKRRPTYYIKEKQRFMCPYCNVAVQELNRHVANVHQEHWEEFNEAKAAKRKGEKKGRPREWPQKCELCDNMVASKWHYHKHLRSHSKDENIDGQPTSVCDICGESFPTKGVLDAHVKSHINDVSCDCGQFFRSTRHLNEHLLLDHKIIQTKEIVQGEGSHLCTICGKGFHSQSGLGSHVKIKHGNASSSYFPCDICSLICKSKQQKKIHMTRHNPPTLPCPECGKLFNNKMYVLSHVKATHTPDDQKKFQCDLCSKGFMSKSAIEGHMNWHNNLKPFKCDWCPNSYQNQSNLRAHQKKNHSKEMMMIKSENKVQFKNLETTEMAGDGLEDYDYVIEYHES